MVHVFSRISGFSCGFHVFHCFMCVYQIARYHVQICNFPCKKRPPQVRFDLPEMQVLKGKAGLVGVIFRRPIQVEN